MYVLSFLAKVTAIYSIPRLYNDNVMEIDEICPGYLSLYITKPFGKCLWIEESWRTPKDGWDRAGAIDHHVTLAGAPMIQASDQVTVAATKRSSACNREDERRSSHDSPYQVIFNILSFAGDLIARGKVDTLQELASIEKGCLSTLHGPSSDEGLGPLVGLQLRAPPGLRRAVIIASGPVA